MQSKLESRSSSSRSRSQFHGLSSLSSSPGSDYSQQFPKDNSVTVDLTGYAQLEPEYPCTIAAALKPTPEYSPPSIDIIACAVDVSVEGVETCTGAVCGMDAQAAINFILEYVLSYCPSNASLLTAPQA